MTLGSINRNGIRDSQKVYVPDPSETVSTPSHHLLNHHNSFILYYST